jgi:hypothetical protein
MVLAEFCTPFPVRILMSKTNIFDNQIFNPPPITFYVCFLCSDYVLFFGINFEVPEF